MKSGKGYCHKDPVLIGVAPGNEDNDDGDEEEQQQKAPAFAGLDEEFAEVFLDEIAADDKRDDQPGHAHRDPDGGGEGRHLEDDRRHDFGPLPLAGQVEDEEKEIIGEGEPQQSDQPFADPERAHGEEPGQDQQQKAHGRYIQQGDDAGPDADIENGCTRPLAVVQVHHAVPYPDHDGIDEQGGGKVIPVRQQGGDQDIGHTGQVGRLRQDFMMVEDPIEKCRLAVKQQKGEDRIQDIDMMENGDQAFRISRYR
jgi:hypothetical protein